MAIEEIKTKEGIFVQTRTKYTGPDFEPALKKYLRNFGKPELLMDELEKQAETVLKELGYSGIEEVFKLDPSGLKPVVRYIQNMLFSFRSSREFILQKNIGLAVYHSMMGVQNAMNANLRGIEPMIARGLAYSKVQSENRSKRQIWGGKTQAEIDSRNRKIIEDFNKSKLTPSSFSIRHSNEYNIGARQIRRILKKD